MWEAFKILQKREKESIKKRMEKYVSEHKIKFPPYQIVKHTADRTGRMSNRITVRRLRLKRLAYPIFVQRHKMGLKYKLECRKITGNRILNLDMFKKPM